MKKRNPDLPDERHAFGGSWTTTKLDLLAGYLRAYTTALKDQPFKKGYIDAFAGTGYRESPRDGETELPHTELLFPDLAGEEPQALLDGSARLALKIEPRFDRYVFIEQSPSRCARLEDLKSEFPDLAKNIKIHQGDSNSVIKEKGAPIALKIANYLLKRGAI